MAGNFIIRRYRAEDLPRLVRIFETTVSRVCSADYSPEQISAWIGGARYGEWHSRFEESYTLVAEADGEAIAFGNVLPRAGGGHIDMLYADFRFLRRGVGGAICDRLEGVYGGQTTAESSVTALPFFLSRGYKAVRAQTVARLGTLLENYLVAKRSPL